MQRVKQGNIYYPESNQLAERPDKPMLTQSLAGLSQVGECFSASPLVSIAAVLPNIKTGWERLDNKPDRNCTQQLFRTFDTCAWSRQVICP